MQKVANRVSLGAVYTHTHTSTFREIKRVANEAALFGVKNRLFVALYGRKNKVLEIACFLSSKKIMIASEILHTKMINLMQQFLNSRKIIPKRKIYTKIKSTIQCEIAKVGGVE